MHLQTTEPKILLYYVKTVAKLAIQRRFFSLCSAAAFTSLMFDLKSLMGVFLPLSSVFSLQSSVGWVFLSVTGPIRQAGWCLCVCKCVLLWPPHHIKLTRYRCHCFVTEIFCLLTNTTLWLFSFALSLNYVIVQWKHVEVGKSKLGENLTLCFDYICTNFNVFNKVKQFVC